MTEGNHTGTDIKYTAVSTTTIDYATKDVQRKEKKVGITQHMQKYLSCYRLVQYTLSQVMCRLPTKEKK